MSNNDDSTLEQTLSKTRTRLKFQPAEKPPNKNQATTAGENLFSDLAPQTRGGRGDHSLGSNWIRFTLLAGATLVSALLIGLVVIGYPSFGIQLYSIPEMNLPIPGSLIQPQMILAIVIFMATAYLSMFLYLWSRPQTTYGQTVGMMLSTAGDGTVQASFTGAGIEGRFKHILESFECHGTITREECSYGDLLGVTDADDTVKEQYRPYVATVRWYADQPFDALGVGRTTAELLADYEEHDDNSDFPVDGVAGALANSDIPVMVQFTIGARPKDSGRARAVANRADGLWFTSVADATWQDDNTGTNYLARVMDVNVRVLVFGRPDAETTVDDLCETIANAIKGPTNDGVTSAVRGPVSADEGFLENPRQAALWTKPKTVLKRIDSNAVVHNRAHQLRGVLTVAGRNARANLPLTPAEVWRYLLPVGDGLADSKRAHGARRRDQTPTGSPPEAVQDHFRADDGRLAQESDAQTSGTRGDEHP